MFVCINFVKSYKTRKIIEKNYTNKTFVLKIIVEYRFSDNIFLQKNFFFSTSFTLITIWKKTMKTLSLFWRLIEGLE